MNAENEKSITLPTQWGDQTAIPLEAGETILACFEPDLDDRLHYAQELVVLSEREVLSGREKNDGAIHWQRWPLTVGTHLRTVEHGSAGELELVDESGRLASWR